MPSLEYFIYLSRKKAWSILFRELVRSIAVIRTRTWNYFAPGENIRRLAAVNVPDEKARPVALTETSAAPDDFTKKIRLYLR